MPIPRRRQPGATIPTISMGSGMKAYNPRNPASCLPSNQSKASTRSPDSSAGHSSFRRPPSALTTASSSSATAPSASRDRRLGPSSTR